MRGIPKAGEIIITRSRSYERESVDFHYHYIKVERYTFFFNKAYCDFEQTLLKKIIDALDRRDP